MKIGAFLFSAVVMLNLFQHLTVYLQLSVINNLAYNRKSGNHIDYRSSL